MLSKQEEENLFGLYDRDGILRFTGRDREACIAYAELFDLQSIECHLLDIPEAKPLQIKGQKIRLQATSSS